MNQLTRLAAGTIALTLFGVGIVAGQGSSGGADYDPEARLEALGIELPPAPGESTKRSLSSGAVPRLHPPISTQYCYWRCCCFSKRRWMKR